MEKESNIIASNIIVQIIGRVITLAVSLISIKLITNYLGPVGTGYYNTIITYFAFFITFADLGLFSVGVREISKAPEKTAKILNNLFTLRLITAIIATLIATIVALLTNYPVEIKHGVMLLALYPIFNLLYSVYDIYLQTRLQMEKSAIAEIITRVATIVLIYLAVVFNLGFYAVLSTVALAAIVNFFLKYFLTRKEIHLKFEFDKKIISWIFKLSLPLGVVFIVNNFYFKVDTLILFYFKGAAEVGIYSVAYKVLETTTFIAAFLAYSLKPLLSVSVYEDKEKAANAVSRGITFLLFAAFAIAVICIPFSKEIILFLSNQQFLAGSHALVILAFAPIFIYLNVLFGEIMIAKDMRKYLIWVSIIVLLFNISTNIILIPKYSYVAASYTTLASEMLLLVFGFIAANRALPLKIDFARIFKLIFAAALSTGIGFLFDTTGIYFLFSLIISVGFYLIICYLSDAVPKTTLDNYFSSVKKKWIN